MLEITVKLPDDVARCFGNTPENISRHLLESAAIEMYRTGQLSHRNAGAMLALDYWETERFFHDHGVAVNYTLTELEADRATLAKVLGVP